MKNLSFKTDKLCRKANEMTLEQFKKEVISHLKWYNIPREWKNTDITKFYEQHRYGDKQ
jgi:hypothetical protein